MLAIAILAALPVGHQATTDRTNIAKPLKGLSTLYVAWSVNDANDVLKLTDDSQAADQVVKRLEADGFKVLNQADAEKYNASHDISVPELDVTVDVTPPDSNGGQTYNVNIGMTDFLVLARNNAIRFHNDVWSYANGTFTVDSSSPTEVKNQIGKCFDQFEADYKLANKKN